MVPQGPNPLYVAAVATAALLLAVSVAFLTDTTTEAPSRVRTDAAPSTVEPREGSASRGSPRTLPVIPRAGGVRATHSPEPVQGAASQAEPPAPRVAPQGKRGPGSGDPWPNYRDLEAEPAWVQAAAECVISHESRYAGMYQAVNPAGPWYGAYQFAQPTWTSVTGLTGAPTAYGPEVQDDAFATLWNRGAGAGHWVGSDC